MSLHRTPSGCCEKEIGMTRAHIPQYCEHQELFLYTKALGSKPASPSPAKPRKGLRRSQPKRDWSDARRKVEEEGVCRVCGSYTMLEAAHIIGRGCDELKAGSSSVLYVKPERIIPLCGLDPTMSKPGHHPQYDAHELDILEFLTPAEQVQAVRDAGGIESARMRVSPSSYRILEEAA